MLGIMEIDKLLFSTVLGKSQPVMCSRINQTQVFKSAKVFCIYGLNM